MLANADLGDCDDDEEMMDDNRRSAIENALQYNPQINQYKSNYQDSSNKSAITNNNIDNTGSFIGSSKSAVPNNAKDNGQS